MPWILAAAALFASQAGEADPAPIVSAPPERVRSILLSPGERCPAAQGDEVVVCAPQDDPYRIPKAFRQRKVEQQTQSWVSRVAAMDDIGRTGAGLPDTCSVVGSGGQTGCTQAMRRTWLAERRALAQQSSTTP